MLITLILIQSGPLRQPLLYMSPWLERHKTRYVDLMYEVSRKGEWLPWLSYFREAVSEMAHGTIRVVELSTELPMPQRERVQQDTNTELVPSITTLDVHQTVMKVPKK